MPNKPRRIIRMSKIEISNPFEDYTIKPEGCDMGYKVEPGFNDLPFHTWWIKDGDGGVHVWARQAKLENWPTEWIGGVEVHYAVPPSGDGWFKRNEPSHAECWLIDGPCWHDGSSLYFSERVAPRMPHPDSDYANDFDRLPHRLIGFILIDWFQDKIKGDNA